MEFKRNPTARRSYIAGENARRLTFAIQALDQIKLVGFTYLFKDGVRSSKLINLRHVANYLEIPYMTLYKHQSDTHSNYLKKSSKGTGFGSLLGSGGEALLESHIIWMDSRGFPLTWRSIRTIARDIAVINGISDFVASAGWVKRFKRRHPELTTRIAQSLERTRVGGMNPDSIQKYFEIVEEAKKEIVRLNGGIAFTDDLALNLDESGLDQTSNKHDRVVTLKIKTLTSYIQSSSDRTHLSACVCIGGDGKRFKTMYAIKGVKRMHNELPGCPEGVQYIMTEKGYFDEASFEKYINFLIDQLPPKEVDPRWRLLIFDGYGPHTMVYSTVKLLHDNRIHAVCMPSHTSQILQPLDVSCFSPVKRCFKRDLRDCQFTVGPDGVGKWYLPGIFEFGLESGCSSKNIISGFEKCGLINQQQHKESWVVRNAEIFKISENISKDRCDKNVLTASHRTALNSANEAKATFQELIGDPETSSPIKKQVTKLLEILDTTILPLSEKYAKIMCSPPQRRKRQIAEVDEDDEEEESTAKNFINEKHAAAKWVTEDARREKLAEYTARMLRDAEERETKKEERIRAKKAKVDASERKAAEKTAVKELLVHHHIIGVDDTLKKAVLVQFYRQNKQQIDNIVEGTVPNKVDEMIQCFNLHKERLMSI